MTRAELLLALSDERDLWLRSVASTHGGTDTGPDTGTRAPGGYEAAVIDWKITAGLSPVAGSPPPAAGPTPRRTASRYPPGGRLSWLIIPRDGAA